MEIHNFKWENQLFVWPCSIAMLVYQRVYMNVNVQMIIHTWNILKSMPYISVVSL